MFDESNISQQDPWTTSTGYNPNVDFCVWVLQSCGLQASPFNCHDFSDQALQQAGLDVQAWHTWLTLVVATQDDRLLWHVPDIPGEVERQSSRNVALIGQYWSHLTQSIQQDEEAPDSVAPTFDIEKERLRLNHRLHWNEQQYQEAAALAGSFSISTPPAMVWEGEPIVQEHLELLWEEFLAIPKDMDRLQDLDAISTVSKDLRQQFCTRIPCLRIYLVQYPTPVFFAVPPISILVSKAKDLPDEDLRTGIFQAAETLATSYKKKSLKPPERHEGEDRGENV